MLQRPVLSSVPARWAARRAGSTGFMAQDHVAADNVHPSSEGHMQASDVMMAFVDSVLDEVSHEPAGAAGSTRTAQLADRRRGLPPTMTARDWGDTKASCDPDADVLCNAELQARSLCFTGAGARGREWRGGK